MLQLLGQWQSAAFLRDVQTPPEQLARLSASIAAPPRGKDPYVSRVRVEVEGDQYYTTNLQMQTCTYMYIRLYMVESMYTHV